MSQENRGEKNYIICPMVIVTFSSMEDSNTIYMTFLIDFFWVKNISEIFLFCMKYNDRKQNFVAL